MAGGLDRAIGHGNVAAVPRLDLLGNFALLDALHAQRALLHHTAHADCDIRILDQLDDLPLRCRIAVHTERSLVEIARVDQVLILGSAVVAFALVEVEPVEATNLVRTVVGAIPRADAAVVGHGVDALFVVNRRVDRADAFAGGRLAVLAEHRLNRHLRILGSQLRVHIGIRIVAVVAVDAHPEHLAATGHLILADDGDVVLALTGHHAGRTAHARLQVDDHAPLMNFRSRLRVLIVGMLVNILRTLLGVAAIGLFLVGNVAREMRLEIHVLGELGMRLELLEVRLANDRTTFHEAVFLGHCQTMLAENPLHLAGRDMAGGRLEETVGIEAHPTTHATHDPASVTQRQSDGSIGQTGLDPDRAFDAAAAHGDLHHGLIVLTVLGVGRLGGAQAFGDLARTLGGQAQRLGGLLGHHDDVIPSDLGDGVRHLLEPTVVGESAIIDRTVAMEHHFDIPGNGLVSSQSGRCSRRTHRSGHGRRGAVGQETVVQESLPRGFIGHTQTFEGFADDVIRSHLGLTENAGQYFKFGQAAEERFNQRLDGHHRAVGRAGITP